MYKVEPITLVNRNTLVCADVICWLVLFVPVTEVLIRLQHYLCTYKQKSVIHTFTGTYLSTSYLRSSLGSQPFQFMVLRCNFCFNRMLANIQYPNIFYSRISAAVFRKIVTGFLRNIRYVNVQGNNVRWEVYFCHTPPSKKWSWRVVKNQWKQTLLN